jgi:predicted site-specific integrase-resolvase
MRNDGVMVSMAKLEIDGVTYFSATELLSELGVSRQTLWRWRHDGKVPAGHRYRDRTILFTADEVELIRQYANRIEPTDNQ